MRLIKNEKGYALVFVLLIITVIFLLTITISSMSLNNAKQINRSEEEIQVVSLAEMGVKYYRAAVITALETTKASQTFKDHINATLNAKILDYLKIEEITTDNKAEIENILQTDEAFKNALMTLATQTWANEIAKNFPTISNVMVVDPESNFLFKIENTQQTNTMSNIKYSFTSVGELENKSLKLNTSINIPINTFTVKLVPKDSDDGNNDGGNKIPTGNTIPNPGTLTPCISGDVTFGNDTCQYTGNISFKNNDNLSFSNSTIKVTGSINIAGNVNNMHNSTIYVGGSMSIGGPSNGNTQLKLHVEGSGTFENFNGLNNSIIEILGSTNFKNVNNIENSIIYIGGTGDFENVNGITNSIIYVGSNADFKGLNVGSNAKICVNGHLDVKTLNMNGTKSGVYAKSSNNNMVNTNPTTFNKECGVDTSSAVELIPLLVIDWGSPTPEADYSY